MQHPQAVQPGDPLRAHLGLLRILPCPLGRLQPQALQLGHLGFRGAGVAGRHRAARRAPPEGLPQRRVLAPQPLHLPLQPFRLAVEQADLLPRRAQLVLQAGDGGDVVPGILLVDGGLRGIGRELPPRRLRDLAHGGACSPAPGPGSRWSR
ncbi:hypothetical protein [Teichococcus aestuarii]|uniref:hypothetical protein n=1 Tax=Teichococcus aestuarii TaxID=568898 RepID=UPI00360F94FC